MIGSSDSASGTADGMPRQPSETTAAPAMVRVDGLSLHYGDRAALNAVSLHVEAGELFGLLGPNGSGKSTLLRILATLLQPSGGRAEVDGLPLTARPAAVRRRLGVVFQTPSLDAKLTVAENLRFQGYLYGMVGRALSARMDALLARLGLSDRRRERVETLSGGLKRRLELAKALLHQPPVLLLDEPSTGLDLGSRRAFWEILAELQAENGLTVLLATHQMEEADRCRRVALLDEGRRVALDTPLALKQGLGEMIISLESPDPPALAELLAARMNLQTVVQDGRLRLRGPADLTLAPRLMAEFAGEISALHMGRPTLGDVFLALTGHAIGTPERPEADGPV